MNFDELRLTSGHALQVVPAEAEAQRMHCQYVGAVPGRAILTTIPKALAVVHGQHSRVLRAGDRLKVGLLAANGPASFMAEVVSTAGMPFPLLYLAYPKSINLSQSRRHDRVHVSLPVRVQNQAGGQHPAEISDLSLSGGRLMSEGPLGGLGESVRCTMSLQIDGLNREVTINSKIRALHGPDNTDSHYLYGLEFEQMSDEVLLTLRSYIHYQMESRAL